MLPALGFDTFTSGQESPKILIRKSRWAAFARCAVHLLPAAVSIGLVFINIRGYFIGIRLHGLGGSDSFGMALLQVAAKTQELLVVASMATIIFHVMRARLFSDDGVPLGLLASGWSFQRFGYFWSAEFWGGLLPIFRQPSRGFKGLAFVGLLVLAGILAMVAGPAAAIIMIPRVMDFSSGGGVYWLNGTANQLWPSILDEAYVDTLNCSRPRAQVTDPSCPSAGFSTFHHHYSNWWSNSDLTRITFELLDTQIRKMAYYIAPIDDNIDAWSYTTHTPTAVLQDAMRDLHFKAINHLNTVKSHQFFRPDYLQEAKTKRYEVDTNVPLVRTACRQNLGSAKDQWYKDLTEVGKLKFPTLYLNEKLFSGERNGEVVRMVRNMTVTATVRNFLTRRRILRREGDTWEMTNNTQAIPPVLAIPVIIKSDETSKLSLIIAKRIGRSNETDNWGMIACSIDARWAKARSVIESNDEYTMRPHRFPTGQVTNLVRTELLVGNADKMTTPDFKPPNDGSMTPIELTPEWYNKLAPSIPYTYIPSNPSSRYKNVNRTTVESLLELILLPEHGGPATLLGKEPDVMVRSIEQMLSMIFADGLSRTGNTMHQNSSTLLGGREYGDWNITDTALAKRLVRPGGPVEVFPLPSTLRPESSTRMAMRATYTGYVMAARSWFDYLCMAIMLLHAVAALAHTGWMLWYGETSEAWDSISELVALAQRSSPPSEEMGNEGASLENVGAGIKSFKTLGEVAWVEIDDSAEQQQVHDALRLRLGEGVRFRNPKLVPRAEEAYS
ncbi:hypothetical protein QBC44DRAFT_348974 [Cladorrhinum sp. PSN332]|nr:hypothetical protein QBC44DRAFT_348974 [Cladorrhinum sp. PSN332]